MILPPDSRLAMLMAILPRAGWWIRVVDAVVAGQA
jgi:hypothetical protein